MSTSSSPPAPLKNQLLLALDSDEYDLLRPYLEQVELRADKILYGVDSTIQYAYFLLSGLVSLLATTEDGRMIEVAQVGAEGVIGLSVVLGPETTPYSAVVQIKSRAMRIRGDALRREFNRGDQLHGLLLGYTRTRLTQISQAVVCNRFHTVEQRLSRWLLMAQNRLHTNQLHLTQQHISDILGTPRTNVAMCASLLQHKNVIRCARGEITIIDQQGLEASACKCYRKMKQQTLPSKKISRVSSPRQTTHYN
jgi:CRP-like cAMP-binding protein